MTAQLELGVEPEPPAPVDTKCRWCGTGLAVTIIYQWPTCAVCAVGPKNRVQGYQRRLGASVRIR